MRTLTRAVLAILAISACTEAPTEAPFRSSPEPPFAPGAGAQSRANLVWADLVDVAPAGSPADWQSAGIRGDDRNRFGVAGGLPSDEYQGAFCGVAAFISNGRASESGALKIDPDSEYLTSMAPSCGGARSFLFYLDGPGQPPTPIGSLTNVDAIWSLPSGAVVLRSLSFANQGAIAGCKLWFDDGYPPANHARITRLPDIGAARQWRIESQGSHRASCTTPDKKGKPVPTGVSHHLPFAVTVTEVPAPHPSFP